jgi:hypothetical protein
MTENDATPMDIRYKGICRAISGDGGILATVTKTVIEP